MTHAVCASWEGRVLAWTAALLLAVGCVREPPRKVLLIGGPDSEGPGRHDYADGVRALQSLLQDSHGARRLQVVASPDGWPAGPRAFDGVATVVWYFDGHDRHPLRDPEQRAAFESAMRRGVGLVALHQASTVPAGDDLGLPAWLGAVRVGLFDRSTEWTRLDPATPAHPVAAGLDAFDYRDEFYPTFRPASTGGTRTPLLRATLHPQFRDGKALLDDTVEQVDVAWAWDRLGGGRSVAYTGGHFQAAFANEGVRRFLRNAVFWTAGLDVPGDPPVPATTSANTAVAQERKAEGIATFHVDRGRSGWQADETVLAPDKLDPTRFGVVWESPQLDAVDGQPPRLYASPLYVPGVAMTAGPHRGERFDVVFAASNNGFVYAINAAANGDLAPGRVLWRTRLGEPCRLQPAPLDGVPTGILSTPVVDVARGRLYVTHCDPAKRWQAYAVDIGSGAVVAGWPVRLDEDTFNALNANPGPQRVPPKRKFDFRVQRGALNLSPDGERLHVVFGESETGWLVAVDTRAAKVASAFAAVAMPNRGSGGIWGAGGPAVDGQGNVYVVTGSGFGGYQDSPNDWTQSVLKLSMQPAGYALRGTYTPFNYCLTARNDIDLGSGGGVLLPMAPDAPSPRLLAVGGKQGNVYLLDADRLPGRLDRRQPCSTDASADASLLAPQAQPQFGTRGPLSVFGPYSEEDAALDLARARSVPATFRDANGRQLLFVTGNTKAAQGSVTSVPPSVARIEVVRDAARAPYLRLDATNPSLVLGNPGSPVVTSNGARDAIVWILDENAPRSALLHGDDAPRPVLYALDAGTLRVLWQSAPGELHTSGKYNEPAFGGGRVYVGADRIQAFGIGGTRSTASAPVEVAANATTTPAAVVARNATAVQLYAQRCAMCHEHAQGNIPPREVLATRSHARIVAALTSGAMKTQARGLDAAQIEALAEYLRQ